MLITGDSWQPTPFAANIMSCKQLHLFIEHRGQGICSGERAQAGGPLPAPRSPGRGERGAREYVPILLTGPRVRKGTDLGTRATFADLGQTIADNFGVGPLAHGTSFLEDIVVEHP